MNLVRLLVLLGCVLAAPLGAWSQTPEPVRAIASLNVQRYLGRWYEIARFPNRFQKQCASDTSADYALQDDASLRVTNQCRTADGQWAVAIGQARQIGGAQSATLQVRFAPAWLSFLPWVWGDYWVIDLDDRYELVAVGEPRRDYLWILSRTPAVDEARYAALLTRLSRMGFEVGRLEPSPHTAAGSVLRPAAAP